MARGPARPWRQLAQHTQDAIPYVRAALHYGYDLELKITEVTEAEVLDFRRGLFNAAKLHQCSLHCHAVKQKDGTYTLAYAVHRKADGRAHVLQAHGDDRTRWPYNPRQRAKGA